VNVASIRISQLLLLFFWQGGGNVLQEVMIRLSGSMDKNRLLKLFSWNSSQERGCLWKETRVLVQQVLVGKT
jgi:hypothetical protein